MKKRIISLLMCMLFLFVSGCGENAVSSSNTSSVTDSSQVTSNESSSVTETSSAGGSSQETSTASSSTSTSSTASSSGSSSNNSSSSSKPVSSVTSVPTGGGSTTSKPNTAVTTPTEPEKQPTHLILMSDVHLTSATSWYGISSAARMSKMVANLNEYYEKDPFETVMILGDTSLDFWENETHGGSYRRHGISDTKTLVDDYLSKLACKSSYLIPGNHEQYSNADWKSITGRDRQYSVYIDGWLFIMLDNFAGDLDPDYDHHGTYTGVDMEFLKKEMAKYPDAPVVLCAHYFYMDRESNEFRHLLRDEKRIVCLFEGHDHVNKVDTLTEGLGSKKVFHLGNFSYTGSSQTLEQCSWGWRNVYISDECIEIDYYTPRNILKNGGKTIIIDEGRKQGLYTIKNPMNK